MKKTPTIFKRDPANMKLVLDEPNPEAAWVFEWKGYPTRKYDGTACLVKDGKLFKRYELKPGKTAPDGFVPSQEADPNTGKVPGWVPVGGGPEDKWHREVFSAVAAANWQNGTYELIGPKVNGNKDKTGRHYLLLHEGFEHFLEEVPRTYEGVKTFLEENEIEGIVWHYGDKWAKIKRRDFGLKW